MKKCLIIIIALMAIFLTGCWDVIEINERIFVTAVGIDLNEDPNIENEYLVTYVYPNIASIKDGGSQKENKFVKSTVVETPFEGSRQLTTRLDKPLFFRHTNAIVVGEELLREPDKIKGVLDGLGRDPRINRKVQIIVAQGKAKDVLSTKTEQELVVGGYLNSMLKNKQLAARFSNRTFSDVMKDLQVSNVSMIPRAVPKKDEFKLSGSAIIKDYKLIGWLGETENSLVALAKGDVISEIVNVPYKDTVVSYVISNAICKKDVHTDNEDINVDINIFTEGYLQEYKYEGETNAFDQEFLKTVEKRVKYKIEKDLEKIIGDIQNKYNADILCIGEHISKFEPDLWKEIEEDWDEIFPTLNINVHADVKIRRTGLTK
ncbi:Ger(x)C family spore germination protein [Anaerosalibacter bizertensis]|uniref:Ger(X)C family spore germination protein n=1 Tax=Anaerosalibacter bizertensis TaxID=932217 RepID=A0A9Q4ACR1_9FIRM|nr:Ger(x)C family spore germination protein [Anaerosalibacter bizertensis]MCB5560154.1 Ger(x)C family spore germination protein [Anaerosalibacter bizertensis]MCG4565489.1 Ger(x)C family spore germination protein [Anaerosalibacter bizertensis]